MAEHALAYAHRLYTPHSLQEEDAIQRPLLEDIQLRGIKDWFYRNGEQHDESEEMAVMDFIINGTHRALYWPPDKAAAEKIGASWPPVMQDLERRQVADCYGFSIVASECLQEADIDHWVGFANGHATLLKGTNNNAKIHLTDPLTPEMSQDLTPAIVGGPHQDIPQGIERYGHAAVILNTNTIASNMRHKPDYPFRTYPWLNTGGDSASWEDLPYKTDGLPNYAARKIIMSIMEPATGRQVLRDHSELMQAVREDDVASAANSMQRIGSFFPDMDARQPHKEIKYLMKELGQQHRVLFARQLLKDYFATFVLHGDSRFTEAQGDCLRILAREGLDLESCQDASVLYERALKQPNSYKQTIKAKLAIVAALKTRLEVASRYQTQS